MTKKQKAILAIEALKNKYPLAKCSLEYKKPHELLIATRLSAQCTDARVNMITPSLFARFPSIDAFAEADLSEVEQLVRSCGFYKTKSADIIAMCQMLREQYNYTLPDTVEELIKLPGVGRKTANLIVGDVYKKPAIVCDTHCIRICGRLGLTDSKDPFKTEMQLKKLLPQKESNYFCHRLVLFGRETCKARNPACENCEMIDFCQYYKNL